MATFTIVVTTDNPAARSILSGELESRLLGGVDRDGDVFYDAWIDCTENGVPMPNGLVYAVELDGAQNTEGQG